MNFVSFRVLGPLEVEAAGRALPLGGPKPRMLLAALVLQPNVVVSTELLIDVLWPGTAPRSAAANVRTYVHHLRRRLTESSPELAERIQGRASGYLLTASPDEIDLVAFERRAAAAARALDRREPEVALELFDRADALWRGDILEGLPHDHSWGSTVARLTELRLSVQEQRLRVRIELGQCAQAIAELRGLVATYPLREELWQQLITALAAAGRKAEARQAYQEVERILREELGAAPSPRLREVCALLHKGSPQPTVQAATRLPVCQLPLDLPDFTGRESLVGELVDLVHARRSRGAPAIVVLSGAPGVGKSTLAVRVAHALRAEFPDGQLHLDLAGTSAEPRTPMPLLAELLRALGVTDSAMPRALAERAALLRSRLSAARLCVLLDDAAGAAQVRPLLPGAGTSAVVITSRTRMPDLAGAASVGVDLLSEREAGRLLTGIIGEARTRAEPDGAEAIVRHCGRLPLAIRVAGAKLTHRPAWTLGMYAARLRDERRRLDELRVGDLAVRASVTLSYDQLPPVSARAFRLLGVLGPLVFPGWVVAALLGRPEAEDVLDTLVDAHLVELVGSDPTGQPRYRLHDLLRCYAAEKADGEPGLRAAVGRVLEGYLSLALDAVGRMPIHFHGIYRAGLPDTWSPRDAEQLLADPAGWFAAERTTAVAAVALGVVHGLDDLVWRLAAALTPYFDLRGHQDDWDRTNTVALGAAQRCGDVRGQAMMHRNVGQIQLYQDTYAESRSSFEESRRLFAGIGDDRGAGIALAGLGTVLRVQGENEQALDYCHEALTLFAKAGDKHGAAVAMIATGAVWLGWGCHAPAGRWFADAHALAAEIGDRHREAHALKRLGLLHQHRGNLAQAREHVNRAIGIFEELGDDHCVGYANQNLGELCLHSGDLAHARLLLANSLSVHRRNGDRRSEAEVSQLLGELHQALGQPVQSREHSEHALELWRELAAKPQESALAERLRNVPDHRRTASA
jgi:DNA-binding SARP family transcriptional activator